MAKEAGKIILLRTYREVRDAVVRKAAERVLEGRVGLGPGASYSANQCIIELVCDELNIQYSKEQAVEDVDGKIGLSLRFPEHVHAALLVKAQSERLSFNEKLNQILQKKLDIINYS